MWTVDLATAEAALLAKDARIADQVHMRGDPVELRPTTAAKSRLIFLSGKTSPPNSPLVDIQPRP
jgi:hypothetical protein